MANKRGRPPKQPIAQRITSALDVAQEEINTLLPAIHQNLVPAVISPEVIVEEAPRLTKDVRDDYDFARTNLHGLLERGNKLLAGVTTLAEDSDHPRTYEVAGNILKVLLDGTRELMTLQKDIREVEKKTGVDTPPVNIEHADSVNTMVMEGTTQEMLEMLQEMKQKKIAAQEQREQGN